MSQVIKATTMNVSLTAELEAWVQGQADSGRYNSRSEVIREALRLLQDREQLRAIKLARLREEIQKGLDSGPAEPWDVEEFLSDMHKTHEHGCR